MSLALVVVTVLTFVLGWLTYKPKGLPPGPKRGILGDNTHQIPAEEQWKTFYQWHLKYGPVVRLLSLRSQISNISEILSDNNRGIHMPYNQKFKNWRSLMHAGMNARASLAYRPLQTQESCLLLRDLVKNPDHYKNHVTRYAMSVVFCVGYGRRVKTLNDDIVVANRKADNYTGKTLLPGKFLVDSWPILLWLPRRLQWFRAEPERHKKMDIDLYMSLMNMVKRQMEEGTARESMATYALGKQEQFGMTDIQAAYALSSPWAAGVGTTVCTVEVSILSMLHYPEVMKKAQDELDAVVGSSRLPDFNDESSLPYVEAIMKETTRWRPIAPTGFPHAVSFLKGALCTVISIGISAIMRDPEMLPDPYIFRPERFLNNPDPRFVDFNLGFGFGRRLCPGINVAKQSLFIIISRMLWAFNLVPANDEQGKAIIPDPEKGTTGLITRPLPFPCSFIPRNADVVDMIMREADSADAQLGSWL